MVAGGTQGTGKAFAASAPAALASPSVFIDGTKLSFTGQQPVVLNDRTLVPMRAIFEALGAQVSYDAANQTVTAEKKDTSFAQLDGDITITLQIGSTKARVTSYSFEDWAGKTGDDYVTLDVPAQTIKGSTMVPLAFVSKALDCHIKWDGTKNRIDLYEPHIQEYLYLQDSKTGEATVRYDLNSLNSDTAFDQQPPEDKEQVFLRTVSYNDVKNVNYGVYFHAAKNVGAETEEKIHDFDMVVFGVVDDTKWTGDYILYDNGDPNSEEYEDDFNPINGTFEVPVKMVNGKPDLSYIPYSIQQALKDSPPADPEK